MKTNKEIVNKMEKIKMTKKDVRKIAGCRPVVSADYLVSCYLKEKCFRPIGYNRGSCGWNFDIYEIGNAIVCAGYQPGKWDGEITKNPNSRSNKTVESVISDLADSVKVKGGYKTWGWLAEELIKSEIIAKPFRAIFRPYKQYGGKWASRSYYKIPEGLNEVCERLGITYELKNDAPRGGKAGDYLEFRRKQTA